MNAGAWVAVIAFTVVVLGLIVTERAVTASEKIAAGLNPHRPCTWCEVPTVPHPHRLGAWTHVPGVDIPYGMFDHDADPRPVVGPDRDFLRDGAYPPPPDYGLVVLPSGLHLTGGQARRLTSAIRGEESQR